MKNGESLFSWNLVMVAGMLIVVFFAVGFFLTASRNEPAPPPRESGGPLLTKAVLPGEEEMIVINAADFSSIEGPIKVLEDPSCAGGKCLYLPDKVLGKPVKLSAKATYRFKVKKAGTYRLWIRHWWKDECGNSLLVSFDGGEKMLFGDDGTVNRWRWPPALKLEVELAEGEHTLTIIPREDGLKFDQILLTPDPEYYPTGIKKPTRE